jgi:hypothetical protein
MSSGVSLPHSVSVSGGLMRDGAVVALIVPVAASSALGGAAATSPRTIRVTLDDKANDTSAADVDLSRA